MINNVVKYRRVCKDCVILDYFPKRLKSVSKFITSLKRVNDENERLFGPLLKVSKNPAIRSSEVQEEKRKTKNSYHKNVSTTFERKERDKDTTSTEKQTSVSVANGLPPKVLHKVTRLEGVITKNDTSDLKFCSSLNKVIAVPDVAVLSFPLNNVDKVELYPGYVDNIDSSLTAHSFNLYSSVTQILRETMSESNRLILERWKAAMVAKLGEEGFKEFSKGQMLRGISMHELIQGHLSGVPRAVTPELEGCWRSVKEVFPLLSDVALLEANVVHPQLKYKGIIDCIAFYKKKPVLIEWKKSDKSKSTLKDTYDYPVQIAAYMGAINYDHNFPFSINEGLLVIAYSDGTPADLYHLNEKACQKYWFQWLSRLHQYYQNMVQKTDALSEEGKQS